VEKPDGNKTLGRPRCRWVGNIKVELGEVDWGYIEWIGLSLDGDSSFECVMNLRVPQNAGKL
jgi:hypothetical protein